MILLVIALVGVSGYAVAVSYGPKLWSEDAGAVAFAAGSLSLFTALVSSEQRRYAGAANTCGCESMSARTRCVENVNPYPTSHRCCDVAVHNVDVELFHLRPVGPRPCAARRVVEGNRIHCCHAHIEKISSIVIALGSQLGRAIESPCLRLRSGWAPFADEVDMAAAEQLVRMGAGGPRLDPHQDFRRPRWCKKCQVKPSCASWL